MIRTIKEMKTEALKERRDQVEGSIRVLFEGHFCVCRWDGHEYVDLTDGEAQEVLDAEEENSRYEDLLDQRGASD